jgi:hypothetical protein
VLPHNITDCHLINDVSMLGDVKTLILTRCTNICDISMLGNVNRIGLAGLSENLIGLPHDNNVKFLTISSSLMNEVTQFRHPERLKRLTLYGDIENIDIIQQLRFRFVYIQLNYALQEVIGLQYIQKLSLESDFNTVKRISNLPSLTCLSSWRRGFGLIEIDYISPAKLSTLELFDTTRSESSMSKLTREIFARLSNMLL